MAAEERETLGGSARRPKTTQALARRADCPGNRQRQSNTAGAAKFGVIYKTFLLPRLQA